LYVQPEIEGFVAVPVGEDADDAVVAGVEVPATGAEYAGAADEGTGAEETTRTGLLAAGVVYVAKVVGATEFAAELV
jgi:hypothetical protein